MDMECFQDSLMLMLCANNIVNSHIAHTANREDGFLIVMKSPPDDTMDTITNFCSKVREFASRHSRSISARTQSFGYSGNDYLVCLISER